MAIKADYLVRETALNVRRNFTLAISSLLTMTIAMGALAGTLASRHSIDNGTRQFQDDIEFIIFLEPEVSNEEIDALTSDLNGHPDIRRATFFDQDAAYEEFKEMFSSEPEMVANVQPEILPPSFRVVPEASDAEFVAALASQFAERAGVYEVLTAEEAIKSILGLVEMLQLIIFIVTATAVVGGVLLVYNTVRVAMFARRREIEVMRLVGATNWFIRLPFLIEGLLSGLIGGAVGVTFVHLLKPVLEDNVLDADLEIYQAFFLESSQLWQVTFVTVAAGAVLGLLSSAMAIGRYLDA